MRQEIKHKSMNVFIRHKNTEYNSLLFNCNKIVYQYEKQLSKEFPDAVDKHLYLWKGKELLFKVWLKKKYKSIHQALKDVGIKVVELK